MFTDFLYLLRRYGLKVSLTEWMALMEALDKGLHDSSFTGFYYLCRALLVKTESDFDRFDRAFLEYFKDVDFGQEVSQELMDWLNRPNAGMGEYDEQQAQLNETLSETEIEDMFAQRRNEQREQHNCGNYWVGTHGMSVFGNSGMSPNGIRVGGEGGGKRAFRVAGERRFRDFRNDNTLDTRQFEVALRSLRQFSGLVDLPATEFDVDNTIKDTANNAGSLAIRYKKPRRNTVKVLLLMDSGGSMEYYSTLCSSLFQAVRKSAHFKDLKVYYFHNCVYSRLYNNPMQLPNDMVHTEWLLNNLPSDYKVIFVGDAQMAPREMFTQFNYTGLDGKPGRRCGMEWLQLIRQRYTHAVWLNPGDRPTWGEYWTRTYDAVANTFPMYPLTVEGMEEAMHKLLVR